MAEKFHDESGRNYDNDVSKKYGFQSQIQSANPSSNPNWTPPRGPITQPASAPLPPTVGPYVQPVHQPTSQLPYQVKSDKLVECARCSVCFIFLGVFLTIVGTVSLSVAKNFDVEWLHPPPTNPLRIIGPIALPLGISLLLLACIIMVMAKRRLKRQAATGQRTREFGGPQPVISGQMDGGGYQYLPNNQLPHVSHHTDDQTSSSDWHHHDTSASKCHDHGTSSSTFDAPPSYDTSTSACDSGPSATTTD